MQVTSTIAGLHEQVARWRCNSRPVALVPTMGNLHAGHLALVGQARRANTRVVASIFVNPHQFGPDEDYARYPRTLDTDCEKLEAAGCDLVFNPGVEEMYPGGSTRVDGLRADPALAAPLCGSSRPGHFDAVVTVVYRLFDIIKPDLAIFGQKDYQQYLLIRQMTREQGLAVRLETAATIREDDGLAMSSRNQYLDASQRRRATGLYSVLRATGDRINGGNNDYPTLCTMAAEKLVHLGLQPEYIEVLMATDLAHAGSGDRPLLIAAAVRIGTTRLIDNVIIN